MEGIVGTLRTHVVRRSRSPPTKRRGSRNSECFLFQLYSLPSSSVAVRSAERFVLLYQKGLMSTAGPTWIYYADQDNRQTSTQHLPAPPSTSQHQPASSQHSLAVHD
jgi:hypothetical protein